MYPAVQIGKEPDSRNSQLLKFTIVRNEEVDPRRRRRGQVNPIRLTHASCCPDYAVLIGSLDCERKNLNVFAAEELLQFADSRNIVPLSRTREHFANGKDTRA